MAPFKVPAGLPETDICVKLFAGFRQLMGIFTRMTQNNAIKAEMRINRYRAPRTFQPGEEVFWKVPRPARLAKRLFPEPSS